MHCKLLAVASAALFIVCPALAQNSGTVTNHAFAVGKGAGKTGFTSILCTQAQLAVGQNAADPICRTLSGDVTIDAAGITAIGASKVTNSQLATAADGTIKSNISGGTAAPSDNGISAVLDKLLGSTRGSIIYRGASAWSSLTPGTSGNFLRTNGAGADPTWVAAPGSGTVTSAQVSAGAGISVSGTCTITTTGTCTVAQSLTNATADALTGSPTGTTSGTGVMMGIGGTCKITPVYSGRVKVELSGNSQNSVNAAVNSIVARFGTGAAPSNGAALTGTSIGAQRQTAQSGTVLLTPVTVGGIVTGLTPGTAYWFDFGLTASTGTASLLATQCTIMEF